MKILDLKEISLSPEKGTVLAYTRTKVIFRAYEDRQAVLKELSGEQELLEVHLFDANKEYRAVMSESHRFKDGFVECIAEFPNTGEGAYTAEALLEGEQNKLKTICHLQYNENGMAYIDNYRLSM